MWDAFWSGGISNPLEVIEQITFLLYMRRLDIEQQKQESKANALGLPIEHPVFGPTQQHLRWSRLKQLSSAEMHNVIGAEVFPFLRMFRGEDSTYASHMKDARYTIPTSALLAKVVDVLDTIPLGNSDTNGDLYEYMLSKIASAGVNGQFRTPLHIIEMIVKMMDRKPGDVIGKLPERNGYKLAAAAHSRHDWCK